MKALCIHQQGGVVLNQTDDDQQLLEVKQEEVPYPCSSSLDQQNPELLHIKKEEEELQCSQEGELLPVKSEDEENPPLLQLHQIKTVDNSETEPSTSSSTEQIKTETDGEDCGGPEPDRDHDPNTEEKASDSPGTEDSDDYDDIVENKDDDDDWAENMSGSRSENEDGDEDWRETRTPRPRMKSNVGDKRAKKTISCPQCQKQFVYKGSLQKHMTSHSGQSSSSLVDEKRSLKKPTGTGSHEKPFGCDKCGKRFCSKYTLKHHMTVHTAEKFTCDDCGKTFRSQFLFQLHMRPYWKEIT